MHLCFVSPRLSTNKQTSKQTIHLFPNPIHPIAVIQILKPTPLPPPVNGAMGWRVVQLRAEEEVEHRVAAENKEEPNHGIQVKRDWRWNA